MKSVEVEMDERVNGRCMYHGTHTEVWTFESQTQPATTEQWSIRQFTLPRLIQSRSSAQE